ncbi:MAG TPA: hypothetical protein PL143_20700 [Rhodocyclaceae bacterium]|nr:hypothetical protein [Rhodocyclaceae bacterium]
MITKRIDRIDPCRRAVSKTAARCALLPLVAAGLGGCDAPQVAPQQMLVWSVKIRCVDEVTPINLPGAGFDPAAQDSRRFERTEVNLHNVLEAPLEFRYKAVAPRTSVGAASCVSSKTTESLAANEARTLSCGDFQSLLQASQCPAANEGFLAIDSGTEMQVVAVYTEQLLREALYHIGRALAFKNYGGPPIPPEHVPLSPLDPQTEEIAVAVRRHPQFEEVGAIGAGLGLGAGTGVGVGAGISIDVEYVVPMRVPR